jgi:hypothetical protein
VPTAVGRAALEAANDAGLSFDPTYTAKCLASLIERAAVPAAGPLLFWNTYNAVDAVAAAPRPLEPDGLPPALQRRLAREV